MCQTMSDADCVKISPVERGCCRALFKPCDSCAFVSIRGFPPGCKYLISRKFPTSPKNAPQNLSHPPQSTFPSQVPAITNSNHLTARAAAQFITLNSEFIIPRERSQPLPFTIFTLKIISQSPNTISLHKNTLKRARQVIDRSPIALIDPDRPQTIEHQHQSTSDRFLKSPLIPYLKSLNSQRLCAQARTSSYPYWFPLHRPRVKHTQST